MWNRLTPNIKIDLLNFDIEKVEMDFLEAYKTLSITKASFVEGIIFGIQYGYLKYIEETDKKENIWVQITGVFNGIAVSNQATAYTSTRALWKCLNFKPKEDIYVKEINIKDPLANEVKDYCFCFPNPHSFPPVGRYSILDIKAGKEYENVSDEFKKQYIENLKKSRQEYFDKHCK